MLVNEFPPLPVGGAEIQAERLATYLADKQWPVWVVTRGAPGLPPVESRNSFTIIRPLTLGIGKIRTITFMFFTLATLFKLRRHYKVLHAHLAFGPAFVAVSLGRLLGKRVIVKLGGSGSIGDVKTSQKTLRGRIRLAAIRAWADVVVVLTDVMRREALTVGISESRIRMFNNGIDASLYMFDISKEDAKHALSMGGKSLVLYVGRLDPIKSLSTILDAIALSRERFPALHFIVVGDGPERVRLKKRIKVLHLESKVDLVGNQKDVKPYLAAADMFVLPSKTEGISNALLEAMSSQIACLTTPVGGNLEVLVNGKYGILVPFGDVNAWADKLVEVGIDYDLRERLGRSARERVLETYDFNVVGRLYEDLYTELLKSTPALSTDKRVSR